MAESLTAVRGKGKRRSSNVPEPSTLSGLDYGLRTDELAIFGENYAK